mgnify:CR=1 FL=1
MVRLADEPALSAPPDPSELLDVLLERTGASVPDHAVARAVRDLPDADWPEQLDHATEAVGLRVRWTRDTAQTAAELSRSDLPVVTCVELPGIGLQWVALHGVRHGNVRVHASPSAQATGLVSLKRLARDTLGSRPGVLHLWGLVEPALPAAPVRPRAEGGPTPTPLQRLSGLLDAERSDVAAVVFYAVAIGILSLATPLAIQVLINWLAFGALRQPIIALGLALLGCLALAAVLQGLQRVAVEMVQRRIFVRMVADLTTRLSRVRVRAFDDRAGPELVNRFFDVLTVQKAVATLLLDGLGAVLQALVGLALLAVWHPFLMAYDLAIIVSLGTILFILGRGAQDTAIRESKAKYAVAFWMEELARHPMAFKLAQGQHLALARADALTRAYLGARDAHWTIYLRQLIATWALQVVAGVALLGLAGALVLDGELSVGQLVAAEFIVAAALAGFAKVAHKLDSWYDLLAGIDKLGQLVDLPQEDVTGAALPVDDRPASATLRKAATPRPGGDGVVGPFDLEVPRGSRMAVRVGSGVDGTVACDLLLGVRRPVSGTVLRDGFDVSDLRPSALYRDAVLVRGPDLIHGTVYENVVLGRPRASILEVRRALQRVHLDAAVQALPDGPDTVLTQFGLPLSTPQVLRLMVARALVARPRLLVLDGALDGLTDEDCEAVLGPLLDLRAPWTLVVFTTQDRVARRLHESVVLRPETTHVR